MLLLFRRWLPGSKTVVAFGFPYTTDFRQAAPYSYYIMSLLPWNLLSKGVKDLASAASAVSQGSSAFGKSVAGVMPCRARVLISAYQGHPTWRLLYKY